MNASSWLKKATSSIDRLDAELILADTIHEERIFLHAHPETKLTEAQLGVADAKLKRRQKHEPLAYILGYKEFYGRNFTVTPDVLIPRPETEAIVDAVKNYAAQKSATELDILDVGTGSGCIALSIYEELKGEHRVNLVASDISAKALACAEYNAEKLQNKSISLIKSNLLKSKELKHQKFDIIVANLPYVDKAWPWISHAELKYEPRIALYAKDYGLRLIFSLLDQAERTLVDGGILVLESDISQHQKILDYVADEGLKYQEIDPATGRIISDQSQSSPDRQSLVLVLQLRQNA